LRSGSPGEHTDVHRSTRSVPPAEARAGGWHNGHTPRVRATRARLERFALPWRGAPCDRSAGRPRDTARNHALIDGNKRLALAAVIAFCGLNGRRLTNDEAYDLVMSVAAGHLDNVDAIAAAKSAW
jgi:hypothetical protein